MEITLVREIVREIQTIFWKQIVLAYLLDRNRSWRAWAAWQRRAQVSPACNAVPLNASTSPAVTPDPISPPVFAGILEW